MFQVLPLLTALAVAGPLGHVIGQQPLSMLETMAEQQGRGRIPGHNNATYGPIPEKDQLFRIEFLEIAPSPIPVYGKTSQSQSLSF
jgi:hypothetical protein